MTNDTLNDLLIACAQLRGCYPLLHRTLHEFNWFVTCCIWGWTEVDQVQMEEHVQLYPEGRAAMIDQRKKVQDIYDRWGVAYHFGGDELIRLALAFLEYCREEYADPVPDGVGVMAG